MSRLGTIARRTFLIGTAAVAGGVAFGVYAARRPFPNPNLADLPEGAASFNPWVIVDSEAVTLIAPHGDLGQGAFSSQAALIAEELDIGLDQVDISFGVPDRAYYNTAFADAGAGAFGYMSVDDGFGAQAARTFVGAVIKLTMPMMGTGGSTMTPDSFDKLRNAGAVARETLKLAASQETGVPVDQLRTARGAVILPDGAELPYTSLAAKAATVEPVEGVTLRDPSEWRLLGKPMLRVDTVAKSTGTQDFGVDFKAEGMVYATVCTNPNRGAGMNGYDADVAKGMRGVLDVIEITNGVAVIADNTWRAINALRTIDFDWQDAPYPAEQPEHWAALEKSFNDAQLNAEARNDGDVTAVIPAGAEVREYRSPYVAHAPLEPLNATVLVTDDRVDVWTGHQMQTLLVSHVATVTGVPEENVHLHNMFMGGSFGHRLEFEHVKQAAEVAMQMKGVPVKMTYSREEDFAQDFPRHITIGRVSGAVADGQVRAIDVQIAAPSVIGSQMGRAGISVPGPDSQLHEGAWDNPYFNLPDFRVRSYRAPDLAPVSSWRSVGAAPNGFIFDTALDELIHEAGADPLEERIRLMGHEQSVKVLEAVGEMSTWGESLPDGTGKGVAFVLSFGVPTAVAVQVTNTARGIKLDHAWIAADVGQVIDPVNLENMAQGGVIFGLGHAINAEITYSGGSADQSNYHAHEAMRIWQAPSVEFRALENLPKIRGFGEPPVPPSAPALGNAIFAATGQRIREMPFQNHIDFV